MGGRSDAEYGESELRVGTSTHSKVAGNKLPLRTKIGRFFRKELLFYCRCLVEEELG